MLKDQFYLLAFRGQNFFCLMVPIKMQELFIKTAFIVNIFILNTVVLYLGNFEIVTMVSFLRNSAWFLGFQVSIYYGTSFEFLTIDWIVELLKFRFIYTWSQCSCRYTVVRRMARSEDRYNLLMLLTLVIPIAALLGKVGKVESIFKSSQSSRSTNERYV